MKSVYVVVDVGCLECGEGSAVLGIFTSFLKAKEVMEDHKERQKKKWHGQHSFFIKGIRDFDRVHKVKYE